jgi:hypothetical protein
LFISRWTSASRGWVLRATGVSCGTKTISKLTSDVGERVVDALLLLALEERALRLLRLLDVAQPVSAVSFQVLASCPS